MKTLFQFAVVLLLVVVVVGYFRGWYTVSRTDDESQVNVQISIDKTKIQTDRDQFESSAREKIDSLKNTTPDQEPAAPR